jgi:hypothetical protein
MFGCVELRACGGLTEGVARDLEDVVNLAAGKHRVYTRNIAVTTVFVAL